MACSQACMNIHGFVLKNDNSRRTQSRRKNRRSYMRRIGRRPGVFKVLSAVYRNQSKTRSILSLFFTLIILLHHGLSLATLRYHFRCKSRLHSARLTPNPFPQLGRICLMGVTRNQTIEGNTVKFLPAHAIFQTTENVKEREYAKSNIGKTSNDSFLRQDFCRQK